jgi:hypothetical protein
LSGCGERYPSQFSPGSTLQRHVRERRPQHGADQEVYFEQTAVPGSEAALDLADASDFGVTIAGAPFAHLVRGCPEPQWLDVPRVGRARSSTSSWRPHFASIDPRECAEMLQHEHPQHGVGRCAGTPMPAPAAVRSTRFSLNHARS